MVSVIFLYFSGTKMFSIVTVMKVDFNKDIPISVGCKIIIQSQHNHWKAVLRRRVSSILLVGIIALTIAVPSIVPGAESDSASKEALLENEPWIGDFDQMAEKRRIRVLVTYSKTFYFLDRGKQRGITYDLLEEFEKYVNKKLKTKTLKINVVSVVSR